jgi:hypothetical protein
MKQPLTRTLLVALLGMACLSSMLPASESIHGRIHGSETQGLRVCFDQDFKPSRDAQFTVLRHVALTNPKGEALGTHSESVGVVRVAEPGTDHCGVATVVRGHAAALDWVASTAP